MNNKKKSEMTLTHTTIMTCQANRPTSAPSKKKQAPGAIEGKNLSSEEEPTMMEVYSTVDIIEEVLEIEADLEVKLVGANLEK